MTRWRRGYRRQLARKLNSRELKAARQLSTPILDYQHKKSPGGPWELAGAKLFAIVDRPERAIRRVSKPEAQSQQCRKSEP